MEDSLSIKSNESLATSDEFDFIVDKPSISKTPTLNVANGDLNELKNALTEVLQEQLMNDEEGRMNEEVIQDDGKKIGQSIFYGTPVEMGKDPLTKINDNNKELSPTEKQDSMKPDSSEEEEGSSKLSNLLNYMATLR